MNNRHIIERKSVNRLWINYIQVDYGNGKGADNRPRTWQGKKLERAHFGISTLAYRTVKRMKIVYNYFHKNKGKDQFRDVIVVRCDSKVTMRKFYKFLEWKNDIGFTHETGIIFANIKKERKLKVFDELGS